MQKRRYHAPQCRKRARNNDPVKANLVQADDHEIIAAVISHVNMVTNMKEWVVDSGTKRHICADKSSFSSYTAGGDGEEIVCTGDSRTAQVL